MVSLKKSQVSIPLDGVGVGTNSLLYLGSRSVTVNVAPTPPHRSASDVQSSVMPQFKVFYFEL